MRQRSRPGSVLFDLDGTLVDTAPDMARALNRLLAEEGRQALEYPLIRPQVSNGARGLLKLGFELDIDHRDFDRLRERFLSLYASALADESRLFEGMDTVLARLEQADIPWGIVTNKPSWLTLPLLTELGILERAQCVVSGDTCTHAKPHPMPLLHAASNLGLDAVTCLYVGDAQRDVEAARAAGMPVMVAIYGYLEPGSLPDQWGADALLAQPTDLLALSGLGE